MTINQQQKRAKEAFRKQFTGGKDDWYAPIEAFLTETIEEAFARCEKEIVKKIDDYDASFLDVAGIRNSLSQEPKK